MVNDGDCIAIFHSVHRVMKAEAILKKQQINFLLIPAPRQLSADCGMAICFPLGIRQVIEDVLGQAGLAIGELWLRESGEYQRLL